VNIIDPHYSCKQKKQLFLKFITHEFGKLKFHTIFIAKVLIFIMIMSFYR